MSKSTLSITVTEAADDCVVSHAVEVPCRLPDSFDFRFSAFGTTLKAAAYLSGIDTPKDATIGDVELLQGPDVECGEMMEEIARRILATIKATLGITGPVPPGSPLPAIALAYDAECAAYEAEISAVKALPMVLRSPALLGRDPSNGADSNTPSCIMLAKYVEYVVEQACKAQTDAVKVAP